MKFDPTMLERIALGDAAALDEVVEFDDGSVKRWSEVTKWDLAAMEAWLAYKEADDGRKGAETLAEAKRRYPDRDWSVLEAQFREQMPARPVRLRLVTENDR